MTKRSAVEAASGAGPLKKLQLDELESTCEAHFHFQSLACQSTDITPPDLEDPSDDLTTAQTPSSVADAPSSVTTVTTPRAKFPSDLKTLACTWPGCSKTFNRPARLRDHLNSHTNVRPFKCPYDECDKDYIEDKHLKQHIKASHTNERKHTCPREGCGKSFVTGTRLKRHQAVHEGAERFRCQDCGQSFRKRETLTKHMRKEHLGLSAHVCPEPDCGDAFDSKGALNRHRERVHGDIKFWCGECGLKTGADGTEERVGFTTQVLLQAHLKREHQTCMFCDFKASGQWDMEKHVEMKHSGKSVTERKTVACPYDGCGKKFTKKSNLNAHVRSAHEGLRFICGRAPLSASRLEGWTDDQGCGDEFSTKAKLEDHVRFIHLGHERQKLSKPDAAAADATLPAANIIDEVSGVARQAKHTVPCPNCDATFIRYADLHAHINVAHDASAPSSTDPMGICQGDAAGLLTASQPLFETQYGGPVGWIPDDEPGPEEMFAAEMDYGPPRDEWLEDEANIMLLARDGQEDDAHFHIDPSLQAMYGT